MVHYFFFYLANQVHIIVLFVGFMVFTQLNLVTAYWLCALIILMRSKFYSYIKNLNLYTWSQWNFFKIKTNQRFKIKTKEHNNRQNINICVRNLDTKRYGKQLNIFERKVYRGILGPVYDNENENWRISTNKEIYASVKKPTIIETIRLKNYIGFGGEWKQIEFPKG